METYLAHHGILGMKWGIRRYQNPDGTLTSAGEKRYNKMESYRTKLQDKAKNRSTKMREMARESDRNVRDLKKNGTKSKAYEDWKRREDNRRAYEYERKNSIAGEDGKQYVRKYDYSGDKTYNDIFDRITSKSQVQLLINENKKTSKEAKASAERWLASNERLMNTKVTALTKKSDLRKLYWES